jgi:hypothetical protein
MHRIASLVAFLVIFSHARQIHEAGEAGTPSKLSEALGRLLLAQAQGTYASGSQLRVPPSRATRSGKLASSKNRRASSPAMVGAVGAICALPALYTLMSFNEYATHRWYQHEEFNRDHAFNRLCRQVANKLNGRPLLKADGRPNIMKLDGDGHVAHHAETYDDMTLKKDDKWRQTDAAASLDHDDFRGTAFSWKATRLMTVQMLPTTLPVFALLGFNLLQTFAILLPGMLVHALAWNMLHPPMHGLPPVPASFGAPSFVLEALRHSAYFKWIFENHQGHHVLGGRKNYCVCCPLADHVLGTYVPVKEWSKKMRAVPGADIPRWGFAIEPKGVPKAPVIAKGKATNEDLTPTALKRTPEPAMSDEN